MVAKLATFVICCLAVAGAALWRRFTYPDLSAVENLYFIIASIMSRPQYVYHLHGIAHFRERSDLAMGDFTMRESQPVAFRVYWELGSSYKSYATEDGEGEWGRAPKNPVGALMYDEVYLEGKMKPPSDPASVVIKRPHSFPEGVSSQLMPPHPLDGSVLSDSGKPSAEDHHSTIGMHLYAPITCPEAPQWPPENEALLLCENSHKALLSKLLQTEKIDGVSSFQIEVEVLQLAGQQESGSISQSQTTLRPALFYLHGGGLVSLSTAAYDKLMRRMTNLMGSAGGIVISVDYRLSPEHKFPIPLEDCLQAISFVVKHAEAYGIDANRLAVIGDSAGGALVASVLGEALRLPRRYPWIRGVRHAALVYPSLCRGCPTRSHLLYGNKSTLSNDIWFAFAHTRTLGPIWDWRQTPFAIPTELLSQFPPMSMILFTHDIQYEIGILFHERLRRAGVHTSLFVAPGLHGFFGSDAWSSFGVRAVEWTIERILGYLQDDAQMKPTLDVQGEEETLPALSGK